jgi:hypothetical protein
MLPHYDAAARGRAGPLRPRDALDRGARGEAGPGDAAIVAPGGSVDRELVWRVAEHLGVGSVVLLLFQDPAEAGTFEAKLAPRARAAGGKVMTACAPGVSTRGAPRPARSVHLSGGTV